MSTEKGVLQQSFTASIVPSSRIVPAGQGPRISLALNSHTRHMDLIVQKVLRECKLIYRNDPTFWQTFRQHIPIVHWEPCECAPGGVMVYLLCQSLNNYDLSHFFAEMISRWLMPGKLATILSTKHLTFRFVDVPDESYFISEIFALVDDERAFGAIQKNMNALAQEIALGAVSAHHARHILVTKALTQEHKTTLIHKTIVELSTRKFKPIGPEVFFEMHHFLLASDDEFKRIRDVRHMCRIICYHNWFRRLLRRTKDTDQRQIMVKPLYATLRFQFGEKNVIGLVVAMSYLKEYEQFEARHIVSACQRLIPGITVVPRSFFSYQNPSDPIQSYYLEIEKRDGSELSSKEVAHLRQGLLVEIPHCIEQLSHTLFIPQNEEEIMRNILLLSQEIRYVRDIPQMIITFQGQSDTTLRFHVTLLRLCKDANTPTLEQLFLQVSELVEFVSSSKRTIGHVRNKYPKEANTFLLECRKAPFMRVDHSVDLSRAREFISAAIRQALGGEVRDFNGGLMSQQNQLLVGLKELLTQDERKEEIHLENLFHNVQPVLMRSLLPPELIKQLFDLFLLLHNETPTTNAPRFREICHTTALCVMVCAHDPAIFDEMQKEILKLDFKDQELAHSRMVVDGLSYAGYIVVGCEPQKISDFQQAIQTTLESLNKAKMEAHTLRISLPRPTSLLDPRIGTDRTSGIVIKMLYEGLMRIDPSGKPAHAVSESVEISPDQRRYIFTLRKSTWTNGTQVTAYDFEYAWKKVLDPQFKTPFAYLFYPIKNAESVKILQKSVDELGVFARDEYTLEVQLEHPAPYFLELCAHWIYSPLCKEVDQLHPGWAYYGDDTYVSNGPFRLAKWRRNSEIQVLKNPLYWDSEAVRINQIDISIVEDPQRALSLYQRGELDWIGEPLSEIPPEAFKISDYEGKIVSHPIAALHWYSLNVNAVPFTSKKCRQALAIALNRQEMVDKLFSGLEKCAYSILPPGLSQQKDPYFQDGNPEKARALFEEGLRELNLTAKDLPPFMITCCDQEIHRSIALVAAEQWKNVLGIDVKIEVFKWERFMEKCGQHDYQIMGITWYCWVYDPSYILQQLKSQSHEMNFSQWHSAAYTASLDKALNCTDKRARLELMHKAETIVMEELPIIPLFYYTFKYMKKDYLDNIYLSHLGQIDFKWASINPNV